MDIHRKSTVLKSIAAIFEIFTFPIKIMNEFHDVEAKTYLFPVQIGSLANKFKSEGYTDTVLFLTIGKGGDVLSLYIGKGISIAENFR
jgi:hypothetical protein